MSADPRMLSLITLLSQSITSPFLKYTRTLQGWQKYSADDRNNEQDGRCQFPVDEQQRDAGTDDQ